MPPEEGLREGEVMTQGPLRRASTRGRPSQSHTTSGGVLLRGCRGWFGRSARSSGCRLDRSSECSPGLPFLGRPSLTEIPGQPRPIPAIFDQQWIRNPISWLLSTTNQ